MLALDELDNRVKKFKFKKINLDFFPQDHYLAYIELENFGIQKDIPDQRLSVRQVIKDFQFYG